jgi:hypothetical protein
LGAGQLVFIENSREFGKMIIQNVVHLLLGKKKRRNRKQKEEKWVRSHLGDLENCRLG